MVMMERFGSPATRLMSVMKSFQVPVRSVQRGDRVLVITDDAMDPLVWQGAMAAINEKGGEPVLCMWPRLDHHFADPPQMAIELHLLLLARKASQREAARATRRAT